MKYIVALFLLGQCYDSWSQTPRSLQGELNVPSYNTDSLIILNGNISLIPKKQIDENTTLFPIFFSENGLLQFVTFNIYDTIKKEKSYKLNFDIRLDTNHSSLGLEQMGIYFYTSNDFNFQIEGLNNFELHNSIYFNQFVNSDPYHTEKIKIDNSGGWSNVSLLLDGFEVSKIKYLQIGVSKTNKRVTRKLIKAFRNVDVSSAKQVRMTLKKFKSKKCLNGYELLENNCFHSNKGDNTGHFNPMYLVNDIRLEEY